MSKHTRDWYTTPCMSDPGCEESFSLFGERQEDGRCVHIADVWINRGGNPEAEQANRELLASAESLWLENQRLQEAVLLLRRVEGHEVPHDSNNPVGYDIDAFLASLPAAEEER